MQTRSATIDAVKNETSPAEGGWLRLSRVNQRLLKCDDCKMVTISTGALR